MEWYCWLTLVWLLSGVWAVYDMGAQDNVDDKGFWGTFIYSCQKDGKLVTLTCITGVVCVGCISAYFEWRTR